MNAALSTFNFNGTAAIRVVTIKGEPWFVTRDVCLILGFEITPIHGAWVATRHLTRDEKLLLRRTTPHLTCGTVEALFSAGQPSLSVISESGLYRLIMRSDKPEARTFQDWVTRIVLPAIRKDGGYILGEENVKTPEDEDELVFRAFEVLKKKVSRLSAENATMAKELNEITVDEFRALHHAYWPHGFKVRLGQRSATICLLRGIEIIKQHRTVLVHGKRLDTSINVYPRAVLEEALRELSPLLEIGAA